MDKNDFQKGWEYGRVRVNKTDDLFWAKNIVDDLYYDGKIEGIEYNRLTMSLDKQNEN